MTTPPILGGYALVYDVTDPETEEVREEYFEAFDSPEEAKRIFEEDIKHTPGVHNVRLVLFIERLSP